MLDNEQDYTARLDASGLHCPQPVIHCKARLALLDEGEVLYMIASDRDALREIRQLVRHTGNRLRGYRFRNGRHHFYIEKCSPRRSRRFHARSLSGSEGIESFLHTGLRLLHRWLVPSFPLLRK